MMNRFKALSLDRKNQNFKNSIKHIDKNKSKFEKSSNHFIKGEATAEAAPLTDKEIFTHLRDFINEFLTEVGIKPNQRELVRAFLSISNGNPYFEASNKQLASIIYGNSIINDRVDAKRAIDRIRTNLKSLLKWQEENKLDIVQIVTIGNRIKTDDGKFRYNNSKYHLVVLTEIIELNKSIPTQLPNFNFGNLIKCLKKNHQPIERRKSWHPNHKIQKAGKTLITTLENIFHWNIEAKSNPVNSCERFLIKLYFKYQDLCNEYKDQKARNNFIYEFEQLLSNSNDSRDTNSKLNRESKL